MLVVRYINLDRKEYFEISHYGSIITHNASVEAKSKGSNWTHRQQVQRYGNSPYTATLMVYGQVLLMSHVPISSEFAEKITPAQREQVGSWHGNRIIVEYNQNNSTLSNVGPGMRNITQEVKAFGNAYLKYDKVLL